MSKQRGFLQTTHWGRQQKMRFTWTMVANCVYRWSRGKRLDWREAGLVGLPWEKMLTVSSWPLQSITPGNIIFRLEETSAVSNNDDQNCAEQFTNRIIHQQTWYGVTELLSVDHNTLAIGTVIQWNTTQQDDSTALPPNIGPAWQVHYNNNSNNNKVMEEWTYRIWRSDVPGRCK